MGKKGINLRWAHQSSAKTYEIIWNTRHQECDEFVELTKTSKTYHLIPREKMSGRMQLKIRTLDKCDVASEYSRTLALTVSVAAGDRNAPKRNCDGKGETRTIKPKVIASKKSEKDLPHEKIFDDYYEEDNKLASKIEKVIFEAQN